MINQGEMMEEYEDILKSVSATSSRPSQRSRRSLVPQKRGATDISGTTQPPPPPRLSRISARLFLPSTPVTSNFSRDPPLVEVSFRRITVQVTDDFSVLFDEDEIIEEDKILLANMSSSQKPNLTGKIVDDRVTFQSSGWIGQGETKLARYVSDSFTTYLSVTDSCVVPTEGS
jgi:hypothetical protein